MSTVAETPVHPRVCGEQSTRSDRKTFNSGSSPRVRGTGPCRKRSSSSHRFIPACAGNRPSSPTASRKTSVHPRVCGEQGLHRQCADPPPGSSPRVRGTAVHSENGVARRRFIPACAGNSRFRGSSRRPRAVHPRVCGEQHGMVSWLVVAVGSSPRVRGTVRRDDARARHDRFIPACAGNRPALSKMIWLMTVHPRVCGEQLFRAFENKGALGSSPRVRGTATSVTLTTQWNRFIPACAGNSGRSPLSPGRPAVHPRVCGEQVRMPWLPDRPSGSSPRVRGTVDLWGNDALSDRFIPACAGNRGEP